jgi:biopolymer transport protein ExbB/TolQ
MLFYAELGTLVILILCSILALGVIFERFLAWRKLGAQSRAFKEELKTLLKDGDEAKIRTACERPHAPLAGVLSAVWEGGKELRPEQAQMLLRHGVEEAGARYRRFLAVLATLASTAPFIGLFGTVLGIMHTFSAIAQKGFGGPAVVSQGISQALIATAAGLAVAIPCVILYNFFTRRANRALKETEAQATQILIMLGRI